MKKIWYVIVEIISFIGILGILFALLICLPIIRIAQDKYEHN